MVWLLGEALLCRDICRKKKKKPCLPGYLSLEAFALCWLKTIRRLSRIGHGHFHLFTIRSCQESISRLPSSSLSFNITDDKARWRLSISSPAWQRFDAPRESFVYTRAEQCHKRDGIRACVYSLRAHPEANSITIQPLIRPMCQRSEGWDVPQSKTSSSPLGFYISGNNYGNALIED